LSISGEAWEKAIRADVARQYSLIPNTHLYFKFVVQDEVDLKEVDAAREAYAKAGVTGDIYLMAVGATQEGQAKTSSQVAEMAMKSGYKYTPRLHVDLFGNQWGT
jgi:7-carboxy-7-deazaguanine synthase